MRRIFNITFSPTGGTQRVADCLCAALGGDCVRVDLCDRLFDAASIGIGANDLCIVAVPSFAGRVPAAAAERLSRLSGNGALAVLVCVYGNRAWEDTLLEMNNLLSARGFVCIAAAAAIAEHSMLRQYASGRPDAADRTQLAGFAAEIASLIESADAFEPLNVPGNFPYRPIGAFLKPIVTDDCMLCGVCADMCPAGAIDADCPNQTDLAKCISCVRCVSLCPVGARRLDEAMLCAVEARIGKMMTGRKQNEFFLTAPKGQ